MVGGLSVRCDILLIGDGLRTRGVGVGVWYTYEVEPVIEERFEDGGT